MLGVTNVHQPVQHVQNTCQQTRLERQLAGSNPPTVHIVTHNLVLLPGLLCDEVLWAGQVGGLADCAQCWIPPALAETTVAEMAARVLREAPFESFALAGLSMGGYVCMEIMRQAPERVSRLALLDTRATPDLPEETERRRNLIALARSGQDIEPIIRRLLPVLLHPENLADIVLVDAVIGMAKRTGIDAFIRQQHAIISRPDSRSDLAAINIPTMVLCGRQDTLTPLAGHQAMADAIAESRLVVIEDAGHLSTMEQPHAVNQAMRAWLGHS
ncbi:MAG: alpha/beta hydrolase [Gammaproteobacteria bacterium]|nr:alpha/beta hydrolase [Gammaproteobacteria bacterium]